MYEHYPIYILVTFFLHFAQDIMLKSFTNNSLEEQSQNNNVYSYLHLSYNKQLRNPFNSTDYPSNQHSLIRA